jgi:predicted PurR-regulated permease PerM
MAPFQRKSKIVNKKFQLKTTFSIMSISIIAFLLILAILGINATSTNREIKRTTLKLNDAIAAEEKLVKTFINKAYKKDSNKINIVNAQKNHKTNMDTIKGYLTLIKKFTSSNFTIISIIIGVILLQALLLYFYLIRLTHRISGPIFVINRHIDEILEGQVPEFRGLREKDEFHDLYKKLNDLAKKISNPKKE